MLKITTLLNALVFMFYNLFFIDDVNIAQSLPSEAEVNTEFIVELTINKGDRTGFAKLHQELPEGFTAIEDESFGASFTFIDQSVKFIWMTLPTDESFTIKYKIQTDANAIGKQNLDGKFSFVSDNIKNTVDIPSSSIEIINGSQLSASEEAPSEESNIDENIMNSVSCKRNVPSNIKAGEDFVVEVTVTKGNLSEYSKLTELLPEGFTATPLNVEGATFSFEDQKVKFIWLDTPSEETFEISYKVSVAEDAVMTETIKGEFAYVANDKGSKYSIDPTPINPLDPEISLTATKSEGEAVIESSTSIGENNEEATETEELTGSIQETESQSSETFDDASEETIANSEGEDIPNVEEGDIVAKKQLIEAQEKYERERAKTFTATTENTENEIPSDISAATIPTPQGSVNYKVQILALRTPKKTNTVKAYFKIREVVATEMMEGYTKYTVGAFNEYKQAYDNRKKVQEENKIKGPFVTAYNDGARITVQEALMITHQQWYQ